MVGQHIRILRSGRWVHAVDCGDETVLHLAEEAPPARVRRAYRPEFVAGADAVEVVTHRERTFPAKEIVRRAYSRASDPALATMFPDSEAFVEWCTTGRLSSARNVALDVPGLTSPASAPAPAPAAAPETAPGAGKAKPARASRPSARRPGAGKKAAARKAAPRAKAKAAAPRKAKAKATRAPRSRGKAKASAARPARKPAARRPAAKRSKAGRKARR